MALALRAEQRATAVLKVYPCGSPERSVALLPSCNRLVLRPANPADPYQQWEKIGVSRNRFELLNRGSGKSMMNVHILLHDQVESAYFHPRLLRATAQWEEGDASSGGFADVGDGGIDIVCVSVLGNHYLPLKIAPWGHDQPVNIEMGAQAVIDEEVAAVVKAENDGGAASDEDSAGAAAGEDDAPPATTTASPTSTRSK